GFSAREAGRAQTRLEVPVERRRSDRPGIDPDQGRETIGKIPSLSWPSVMTDGQQFQRSDLHMTDASNRVQPVRATSTVRDELIVFLLIVALIWPIATVGVVGGFGFGVWMYQLIAGPPGPPRR